MSEETRDNILSYIAAIVTEIEKKISARFIAASAIITAINLILIAIQILW